MCGIFGIINDFPQPFDYQTFCTLGIANDSRGGDSCGIFVDGELEYGIGKNAKFADFFYTSEILNNVQKARIAIGHDRKASVGGVSLAKAHPIVFKNDSDEIEFVFIHNGTLKNYDELAKEFIPDKDVDNLSDSQILALIIYNCGFDVLEKYVGGTAFVAVDYRQQEPIVYLFKGKSKYNSLAVTESEERPLYVGYSENGLIFSSICNYLACCCEGDAYTLTPNIVWVYRNGKFYEKQKIDRSKVNQTSVYTSEFKASTNHTYSPVCNTYIHRKGLCYYGDGSTLLHGCYRITDFGRIASKNECETTYYKIRDVWFYNGYALKNEKCFKLLEKARNRVNMTVGRFEEKYGNFIGMLTLDNLFVHNDEVYEAIDIDRCKLYSGHLFNLGDTQQRECENGKIDENRTTYNPNNRDTCWLPIILKEQVEIKKLWQKFRLMIK